MAGISNSIFLSRFIRHTLCLADQTPYDRPLHGSRLPWRLMAFYQRYLREALASHPGWIPAHYNLHLVHDDCYIYWDRFVHENLGFILWLILYVVTPFLVPVIWFLNRKTDPKEPEENDVVISSTLRRIPKLFSALLLIFIVVGIINPNLIIQIWPWKLSPLTELVICGWISLLGVGAFVMSNETRWSGWKVPLESIAVWHVLVLIGSVMNISDFTNGFVNWYTVLVAIMLAVILALYLSMENRRRKPV
jgi:hypothetical protein